MTQASIMTVALVISGLLLLVAFIPLLIPLCGYVKRWAVEFWQREKLGKARQSAKQAIREYKAWASVEKSESMKKAYEKDLREEEDKLASVNKKIEALWPRNRRFVEDGETRRMNADMYRLAQNWLLVKEEYESAQTLESAYKYDRAKCESYKTKRKINESRFRKLEAEVGLLTPEERASFEREKKYLMDCKEREMEKWRRERLLREIRQEYAEEYGDDDDDLEDFNRLKAMADWAALYGLCRASKLSDGIPTTPHHRDNGCGCDSIDCLTGNHGWCDDDD